MADQSSGRRAATVAVRRDGGEARIWLTDDASRLIVKMTAKVSFGTLTMALTSARRA